MINRILIRIKVVQLLYSYLLLDSNFSLEPQPVSPTKEKRFAYSLYLDMLVLMARVAERINVRGRSPLADSRFIKTVEQDDKIRSLSMKYERQPFPYESLVAPLAEAVKDSSIYKNFTKEGSASNNTAVKVWQDLFRTVIMSNAGLNAIFTQQENYSMKGVDRMRDMMMQTFTSFFTSQGHTEEVLKSLRESLDKARELYFRLLMLPIALTDLRDQELDAARHKYIVTDEDIYPNLRFVENQLVDRLRSNPKIEEYAKQNKLSWLEEDRDLMTNLLKAIKESDVYADYMSFPVTDLKTDCEFWRNIFKYVILENVHFLEALEDKSLFWNDDLDIISTFVAKTFRRFESQEDEEPVLEQFKDAEDAAFGRQLFEAVSKNREEYRRYIDQSLDGGNWDSERLAFMDVVILLTAIAELLNFPKIPLNVTVNEYIEMAKAYSTPKSGQFVNGLLGGIIDRLQEEGTLLKQ